MKNINLITISGLLLLCTGLLAQDTPNDPVKQDLPKQTQVEDVIDTVDAVAETEAPPETEDPLAEMVTAEEVVEEAEAQAATVTVVEDERKKGKRRGDIVTISNDSYLGAGERSKDMVTIMGNSSADGYVDGDMITVLGNATLGGYVDGDFVVILGSAEFGPEAEVDGDVIVIGGKMTVHPDAKVDGETIAIPFFSPGMVEHFQELPLFVRECIFLARPISPNVKLTFYVAGVFLIFYLLLAALFPKPLERGRKAIEDKPFHAFFAGILVVACYIPFIVIMLITVVGALLIPVANIALISIAVFGKAVVVFFIGKQIARAVRASFFEHTFFSILIGGVIIYALYMIPFFGLFLWMILSLLGLGAVCIAIGDSISEKKAARLAAMPTPPAGSMPPPIPGGPEGAAATAAYPHGPVSPGTALSQIDSATASLFPRVGFWWRTLATLIDFILVGVITGLLNLDTPLIPVFAYFIIFWGWKGSSLGGMALGLRVQKLSGEPMDWSTAIIRSLSAIVSFLPFFIGFFWAGWDPENQSWHDKIAGTTVVQVPKGYTWS